jgi:hypothetical protein
MYRKEALSALGVNQDAIVDTYAAMEMRRQRRQRRHREDR